jgi:beta-glucosidase
MTLEEKIDMIGGIPNFTLRGVPRLAIPPLTMSDGPLGVHDFGPTTAYAAPVALAASWDVELARRVGESMGEDARSRGVHFILAPGMNIYRAPMCGRNFEYLGEDPYLASRMAVNLIEGIQSRHVIATAKHFMGNNQEYDRFNVSSDIDERTMREIYLPAFEAAVKEAHVGALMDSYNLVNGEHMTQNGYLNNEVVKREWEFSGIIMSDWDATHDGVAAANGGLDLEMPSGRFMNRATLLPAVREGKVSEATIDDKIRRILRTSIEFGFYDHPQLDRAMPQYSQRGRELALQESREGTVLLKNEGHLLPLDRSKIKTIAVLGPNAYPAIVGGGGSSLTKPFNSVSNFEGISNYLGTSARVLYTFDNPPLPQVFAATEFLTAPGGEPGLNGEYFDNEDFQGEAALRRADRHIDFDFGDGSFAEGHPVDHFAIRWNGYFVPPNTGDYKFYTNADDGVRLYVDDQRVIDDWNRHAATMDVYTAHLEGGKSYKIRLEYFEAVGSASIGFGVINANDAINEENKKLAAIADVVVLCLGFDSNSETEGADRSFALTGGQEELIRQIASVNKNIVIVLNAGGNVDMRVWLESVPAVLHQWYPGQEGGTALAQLLFGEYSPSGKLPASFEKRWEDNATYNSYYPKPGEKRVAYSEGVFVGYRHFDRSPVKPQFPFGFGLSYTTFAYSNLKIANAGDHITVDFDLRNTGSRDGAEVAQLYVGDGHAKVQRPVKELKAFARVNLKPGEVRHVSLTLNRRAFQYYDLAAKGWHADPGSFDIMIGSSSAKIELQKPVALSAQELSHLADPYAPGDTQ